ncbi:MAG: hypothetical protein ACRDHI_09270, partial [Actinomycetota bacterium]
GKTAAPHHTRSLAALPVSPSTIEPWVKRELELEDGEAEVGGEESRLPLGEARSLDQADEVLQTERGGTKIPPASLDRAGLGWAANDDELVPPDPNGDVGGGYFLQMVNVVFAIYDANTGAKIEGPRAMSDLFAPSSLCGKHDDGDPVVVYDEYAGVWVISQFALNFNAPKFAQCIAVSETSDPTGAWNAYQFEYPNENVLNDYPKLGVWPAANNSAYFASFNQFRCTPAICDFAWRGAGAVAYERDAMIAGAPAQQIYVNLFGEDPNAGGQLPADADGSSQPGANAPNTFLQMDADEWGYPDDQLEVWAFTADWATPANSTFEHIADLPTATFNPWICGAQRTFCIPQKDSKRKLDALNDRLMFRLQYRKVGASDERLVVAQTVRASKGKAGLRWYELHDSGSGWAIVNQGTYAPDNKKSRWMGSAAMDADGNIAVGYSLSSKRLFPSIAIAGRTAGAPANTLDLAERKVFAGRGSEKGRHGRWGDYSALTVAEDGCTFFYTQQYYKKTGQWKWATRIVRFRIDPAACVV